MTISGLRGGSGKSVTALNLSVSLSLYEKKVLLVDCDPQGCVSEWSGVSVMGCAYDLTAVLGGKVKLPDAISKTEFNGLDILAAGSGLFELSLKLSRLAANEKLFRLLMDDVRKAYDFIILDAPSSVGYLSLAAMTAADGLVAAMYPHPNWVQDFYALAKITRYIRTTHDTDLKIAGILFNRCDGKKRIENGISSDSLANSTAFIYDSVIPEDEAVSKAVSGKTPLPFTI